MTLGSHLHSLLLIWTNEDTSLKKEQIIRIKCLCGELDKVMYRNHMAVHLAIWRGKVGSERDGGEKQYDLLPGGTEPVLEPYFSKGLELKLPSEGWSLE